MNEAERKLAFLLELRELTIKHGIAIGGCGCCGSPWLYETTDVSNERARYTEDEGKNLTWVAPKNCDLWITHSSKIILRK